MRAPVGGDFPGVVGQHELGEVGEQHIRDRLLAPRIQQRLPQPRGDALQQALPELRRRRGVQLHTAAPS